MVAAAQKVGAATVAVGPFTADGADSDGKPDPLTNDKIAKTAFSMRSGEESDVQDAGAGEYYALKVDMVTPPSLPPLAEIRPRLAEAYARNQMLVALRAKADALMAQLRQGKPMDEIAAGVGARVEHQQGLQLIQAEQYKALGREFLTAIFSQKPGDVFAAGAPNGVFIARLDAVRPGDITTMGQFTESIRPRASQDYLRDLIGATRVAAQEQVKANVNLNLARQTLNIDPATIPAPGAKGAAKPK